MAAAAAEALIIIVVDGRGLERSQRQKAGYDV
jgi:hypothetical protein